MKSWPVKKTLIRSALLAGTTSVLLGACDGEAPTEAREVVRPVRTAVVQAAPTQVRRVYPAVVLPVQQAELAFKVSGRVVDLPIRAAMAVQEGDALARLDQREFQAAVARLESQLEQATSQLAAMQVGAREEDLAVLRARLSAAEAQLEKQRAQVARLATLMQRGTIARADFEQERAKLASDEAALDIARQELRKGQAGARAEEVQAQEAAISDLRTQLAEARADLADTVLRAPFDGIIASRNIDNFTNVQANSVVAVLQKLDRIDLQFDVPGADVARFGRNAGVTTTARLDIAPEREFEAQLVEFGTQADADTQTFRGRVSIGYPEGLTVLPGMTGSVVSTIALDDQHTAGQLRVPESALAAGPDGNTFVWVVDPEASSVTRRKVMAHGLSGGDARVSGDLKTGDVVVTAGVSFLREGMPVRLGPESGK